MTHRRVLMQAGAAAVLACALPARPASVFRIAYSDTYSPFSFLDGGQLRGIFPDVLGEVLGRQLGLVVEHRGYPWNRAQMLVRSGEMDAMCTIVTPERLLYAVPAPEPVVIPRSHLFARADNALLPQLRKVRNLEELRQLNPVLVSYVGNGWSKAYLSGFKVQWGKNFDGAVKMLIERRGDVCLHNVMTMRNRLQRLPGGDQIVMLPADLGPRDYQLLVGKRSPDQGVLATFDKAMAQFRKSAGYAEIFQRYGVTA
jgi:polar amino acid transport system substrate-binding protein